MMKRSHTGHAAVCRRLAAPGLLSLALLGCSGHQQSAQPTSANAPVAAAVLTVRPADVPIVVDEVGQTEGARQVEVRARVGGILEKWLYKEGTRVAAGAPLFQIERAPYEIALAQAQSALGQAQARVEQTRREAARLKGLAEQKAISQKEADDADANYKLAAAALEGAQAQVRDAKRNLSYTLVTAPVAGVTGRAQQSEGTLVNAASNSLLTTIEQPDPMWVRFSLSETEQQQLGGRLNALRGAPVELVLPDGAAYPVKGKVNFAAGDVDARLGTIQLRAEVANPKETLLPGQFVHVRLQGGVRRNVFLVPQAAVMQNDQGRFVFVLGNDGKAQVRPVTAGDWSGSNWVILGGLNAGDRVIVDNLLKIRPGAPIKPVAGAASQPAAR